MVYITSIGNERKKEHPWICRSCRTKIYWAKKEYRDAVVEGSNNDVTRKLKSDNERKRSLKMWADPIKKAQISQKLRARDPIVYSKGKSKMRASTTIIHWKTGKDIVCVGSYEVSFVKWCNQNRIDFDWQIPFKMPDGRTYIVDSFIKTGDFANNWIEIKGYMYKIGKEKWEWFHKEHINSILWTKPVLKQIGIL